MKISKATCMMVTAGFAWIVGLSPASAQSGSRPAPPSAAASPPARAPAATVTVSTPDYTETRTGGDQVVTFPGDELPADGPNPYGDTVRRPPGVMRQGLVKPRLNFVSELVKSVENL
jgi:hypothetical protein